MTMNSDTLKRQLSCWKLNRCFCQFIFENWKPHFGQDGEEFWLDKWKRRGQNTEGQDLSKIIGFTTLKNQQLQNQYIQKNENENKEKVVRLVLFKSATSASTTVHALPMMPDHMPSY